MARHVEQLNGGLVTSKNVAVLEPGELTRCVDCIYQPGAIGPTVATGLSLFATKVPAAITTVSGINVCRFANGTYVLLAACSDGTSSLWTAPIGDTGTFTARDTLANIGVGPIDAPFYNNQYFILTGVTGNRVFKQDLTTRRHGLAPVISPLSAVVSVGGGNWSVADDVNANKFPVYYEYWYTEVVKYSDGTELESTIDVIPNTTVGDSRQTPQLPTVTAKVTSATDIVTVSRSGTLANSETTHIRIYRSVRKIDPSATAFPVGIQIAEVPLTDTTQASVQFTGVDYTSGNAYVTRPGGVPFGTTAKTGWKVTSSLSGIPADTYCTGVTSELYLGVPKMGLSAATTATQTNATLTLAPATYADTYSFTDQATTAATGINATTAPAATGWTTPSNATGAIDGLFTTGVTTSSSPIYLVLQDFDFSGLSNFQDPISGLQLDLTYQYTRSGGPTAAISVDGGINWGTERPLYIHNPPVDTTVYSTTTTRTIGGPSDIDWGVTLSKNGFQANNFRVRIRVLSAGATQPGRLKVDAVKATPTYNAAPGATGAPFPAVVITVGDRSGFIPGYSGVGANGKPPLASTGDVFDQSLCTNDTANPAFLRYSLAGKPDYFPGVYFIDFQSGENSQLTCVKTLNNKLVVATPQAMWRVNYLPTADDAQFSRGRALDRISSQYGIANSKCAVTYHGPDQRTELAFANAYGLYSTDGYSLRELTNDVDWPNLYKQTFGPTERPQPICLVNNPELWELILFYSLGDNSDGTHPKNVYELHFNYHPQHLKGNSKLKVGGPVLRAAAPLGGKAVGPTCAVAALRSDALLTRTTSVYSGTNVVDGDGGGIYRSDATSFTTILAGVLSPRVQTRRLYLAQQGNEWKVNEVYVAATDFTGSFSVTPRTIKTGAVEVVQATTTVAMPTGWPASGTSKSALIKVIFNQIVEGLMVTIQPPSAAGVIDYVVVDGEDFGTEESGK